MARHLDSMRKPAGGTPIRVVLVGRTGLDAALRRDPTVELVKVRTTFEAMGEVAEPPVLLPDAPTVVVVGGESDPGRWGAFVENARRLDPGVRIVRTGEAPAIEARPLDGVVAESATVADLRDVILRGSAEPDPTQTDPAQPEPTQTDTAQDDPRHAVSVVTGGASRAIEHGRPSGPGDEALVEAVLAGRDVLTAAVAMIRDRLGREDVEFVAGEADEDDLGAGLACTVGIGGTAGRLVLSLAEPDDARLRAALAEHAAWLGGWLRLSTQNRALRRAAFTDPLTGAWNRRYCRRFLESAMDRAKRSRLPITLLYFDIDGFKGYNDSFGHAAGDEILIEVVKALRSVIRPTDRVCRVGGDEFVVVFFEPEGPRQPDSRPLESVLDLSRRVQQKIRESAFPKLGEDAAGRLTISGGLATYPWDGADVESLIARADELAIESKNQGKNAIRLGPGAERICERPCE